jgi:hypothetical protein
MNRKEEFEALLSDIANAPIAFAGGKAPRRAAASKSPRRTKAGVSDESPRRIKANLSDLEDGVSEAAVLQELRRAKARQRRNPSLFSGDPDDVFTYDDRVLAVTAYLFQAHRQMSSVLGLAGKQGEELRNESYWKWAKTAIQMLLSRNDKSYQTLMGMTPRESIKFDKEILRIAVVGDAGYRGQAQSNVIYSIRDRHRTNPFDLLIHLGDIYFAGQGDEVLHHFLAPFRSAGPRVLTLAGNHDLYVGADAFLSALEVLHQPGRYFSIENPHWRVACLDTASPAETLRRNWGLLDKGQINWLDEQLKTDDGKKTLLMSHHYIISAWEKSSDALKRQLASRLNKIFAWYWGHEHGCAIYDRETVGFHGACVGNGAFMEVWKPPRRKPLPKWYAQGRCSCYHEQSKFWPHGYLELELQPTKAVEKYHLESRETHIRTLERT